MVRMSQEFACSPSKSLAYLIKPTSPYLHHKSKTCSPRFSISTGHTSAWTKNFACSPRLSYPPSTGHAMPCVWTKICLLTKLIGCLPHHAYLIKITSPSLPHQSKTCSPSLAKEPAMLVLEHVCVSQGGDVSKGGPTTPLSFLSCI